MNYDVVLIDFDRTIAKININNYYNKKLQISKKLLEKFKINNKLSPIFDEIYNISLQNKDAAQYVSDCLCDLEINSSLEIYSYSFELLNYFFQKNIPIIIVTNNCDKIVNKFLDQIQTKHMIFFVASRNIYTKPKPSYEMIEFALKNYPNSISNILMIGDNDNDLSSIAEYAKLKHKNFSFIWIDSIKNFNDIIG